MENGWIKLHRKILNNPLSRKPTWAWLWVVLLLLANHDDDNVFIWNGKELRQKKGQFITGRKKLNEITGIPETTIERCLNYLENGHLIGQQKTTKYRLITITKWNEYQKKDSKPDNKRTTNGHNQEIQEVKNNTMQPAVAESPYKKKKIDDTTPYTLNDFVRDMRASPNRHMNILAEYADEKKLDYTTKGQWYVFIQRNVRPARLLTPYTDEQISKAMKEIDNNTRGKKGYITRWTLETLAKYLE